MAFIALFKEAHGFEIFVVALHCLKNANRSLYFENNKHEDIE